MPQSIEAILNPNKMISFCNISLVRNIIQGSEEGAVWGSPEASWFQIQYLQLLKFPAFIVFVLIVVCFDFYSVE